MMQGSGQLLPDAFVQRGVRPSAWCTGWSARKTQHNQPPAEGGGGERSFIVSIGILRKANESF